MNVRPAHTGDVERIVSIIAHQASQGLMLPRSAKVWKGCVACPKYGNCDEIAMVLELN